MAHLMKAIVVESFGSPNALVVRNVPKPEAKLGQVLIRIKAFGINRAEMYMRRGEWAESMPIIGIECVGLVEHCPGGELKPGTVVAALMGGLGRTINGSYAEYTVAPISAVVSFNSTEPPLPWEQLAAIPESYATAWQCLYGNLELQSGQKLLIRGATSSLGKAAISLAVIKGVRITATTRNADRHKELLDMGVEKVEHEAPDLHERLNLAYEDRFDAVLELVGNSVLLGSLKMIRRGGRLCLAGFLGGLAPFPDFNPLLQMASGVHFSFFGSFVFGEPGFPLSSVPLQDIVEMVAAGEFDAAPVKVFEFEEIVKAHEAMEASTANGKMVVKGF
jgi:NADPH:quinone reductase-like Zn-dependent oxidoreductase